MKPFILFLLILAFGIILYLQWNTTNIQEYFINDTNNVEYIDKSNVKNILTELETYLAQAINANQTLKTLLAKHQNGGGYNPTELKQVSKENQNIADKINTFNFAMAEAPIPYDMGTPMDNSYDNTGNLGNINLRDILDRLTGVIEENNRMLINLDNNIRQFAPSTNIVPIIPTAIPMAIPTAIPTAIPAAPAVVSPVTECITKGMYWDNTGKQCYGYEENCKNMDLTQYGNAWPETQWDNTQKQCNYIMEFPPESKAQLMKTTCELLDGKWDDRSNVCFNPNTNTISRNVRNINDSFMNICNNTPGYTYNRTTNTCDRTQTTFTPPTQAPYVPTQAPITTTAPVVSGDDRSRWLNIHNQLRRKHCSPDLVWNDQLAQLALNWTNKLAQDNISFSAGNPIPHPAGDAQGENSPGSQKFIYQTLKDAAGNPIDNGYGGQAGQNLAIGHPSVKTIENVTMDWYNEVNYPNLLRSNEYNLSEADKQRILQERLNQKYQSQNLISKCGNNPILSYKYDKLPECSPDTGHFTQLIWKDTKELGCARVIRPDGYEIYACNYSKPGNVYGYNDQSTLATFTANVLDPAKC